MPVALYVEQQNLVELWALFPESKRSKKKKKKKFAKPNVNF